MRCSYSVYGGRSVGAIDAAPRSCDPLPQESTSSSRMARRSYRSRSIFLSSVIAIAAVVGSEPLSRRLLPPERERFQVADQPSVDALKTKSLFVKRVRAFRHPPTHIG